MESADEDRVFFSVISLAELRYGVERMPTGARRTRLEHWLGDELPLRFEGRIFAVDESVAEAWGKMVSRSEALGRPMDVMDASCQPPRKSIASPWSRAMFLIFPP